MRAGAFVSVSFSSPDEMKMKGRNNMVPPGLTEHEKDGDWPSLARCPFSSSEFEVQLNSDNPAPSIGSICQMHMDDCG